MKKNLLILIIIFLCALLCCVNADSDIKKGTIEILKGQEKITKTVDFLIKDSIIYTNKEGVKDLFNYDLKKVSSTIAIACTDTSCYPFYFNDEKKPLIEKDDNLFISISILAESLKYNVESIDIANNKIVLKSQSQKKSEKEISKDDEETSGTKNKTEK